MRSSDTLLKYDEFIMLRLNDNTTIEKLLCLDLLSLNNSYIIFIYEKNNYKTLTKFSLNRHEYLVIGTCSDPLVFLVHVSLIYLFQ